MDNNDDYDLSINTTSLFTPSSSTTLPSTLCDDIAPENNLYYDELHSRYRLAITRLDELTGEANSLQEENEWLRLANEDLIRRLNRLLPSYEGPSAGAGIFDSSDSPTSVINDEYEGRYLLPKSISVRSPRYFKLKSSSPSTPTTTRLATLNQSQDVIGTKLKYRRNIDKAIEMDVYNQGMYKTELCNKWQETNTCPYGEQCRFAHGLSELRPVIRHPRYKAQICRMVVAGGSCPYGHRCHFRHSISLTTTRLN